MWTAIGGLLPLSVAAALSTVPVLVTVLILLSPRRVATAPFFTVGWVVGSVVLLACAAWLAQWVPDVRPGLEGVAAGVLEMFIGIALILLCAGALRHRGRRDPVLPAWLTAIEEWGPLPCLGVGLLLNLRPKAILLAATASVVIGRTEPGAAETLVLVAFYVTVATSSVTVPVVATMFAPRRMESRLIATREWLLANGTIVTSIILLMIGTVILGAGIVDLARGQLWL